MKLNWNNLTKEESGEYMRLQMSPAHISKIDGYLPDDCSECGACGQPCFGTVGWCNDCLNRWQVLHSKLLEGKVGSAANAAVR